MSSLTEQDRTQHLYRLLIELTSRDHSATSTFLHSRRLFQGPGLPPSNAVLPQPIPGEPPLPQDYHQARHGQTTFFFQIPTPPTSPSSINFGGGLACIRYEVRCTVGVAWKGERRLVTDRKNVEVVERYNEDDFTRIDPESVTIGENGKIWVQGRVVGGLVVAGRSVCVELQVKNHSPKRVGGSSDYPTLLANKLCRQLDYKLRWPDICISRTLQHRKSLPYRFLIL